MHSDVSECDHHINITTTICLLKMQNTCYPGKFDLFNNNIFSRLVTVRYEANSGSRSRLDRSDGNQHNNPQEPYTASGTEAK